MSTSHTHYAAVAGPTDAGPVIQAGPEDQLIYTCVGLTGGSIKFQISPDDGATWIDTGEAITQNGSKAFTIARRKYRFLPVNATGTVTLISQATYAVQLA